MSEFVDYLFDVFEELGLISVQRMFGGYGVYHNNLMFGLVADDVLDLKADDESKGNYANRRLQQFEYVKNGKTMKMSYFMAPDEIYEDRSKAKAWATLAYEAAVRSKGKSTKGRKKKK